MDIRVIKQDGREQEFSMDKLSKRLRAQSYGLSGSIKIEEVISKVSEGLFDGVTTEEIDILASETAAYMNTMHPDYSKLAARIWISRIHKMTHDNYEEVIKELYEYVNPENGKHQPKVSEELVTIVSTNLDSINQALNYERDREYDFFGLKTLEKSYLMRVNKKIVERPQHMLMRVAIGIHGSDIASALETYELLSMKYFTHATPTLFNAGTPHPQMSSCFLLAMKDDSIDGIYDTLKQSAQISRHAGGIGLSIHDVRAQGSYISGTNGYSNGIVPMLQVFNHTARYVDQGGGKRKGSFAIYIEPWHADIESFLELKKNHGKEEMRARDLFYAIWSNDLFMQRVESDGDWTLMCPNECPGLSEVHSEEFNALYTKYENEGKGRATIKARKLYEKICVSQIETGTPYMLHKDAANSKSNQQNLGTIKSSNLCTEIIEYTAPDEVAVCNLASLALPMFVKNGEFDHKKLFEVTKTVTKNLNRVIDRGYYPTIECRNSNMRHRPIGLGVQGLADVFFMLAMPFTSESAKILNRDISETIYYAALTSSVELAIKDGPYSSFKGSPISQGKFQFDLWNVDEGEFSGRWDWNYLRKKIKEFGVRNSLLVAPMPTASTAQILGNNECFEPITSNLYVRRTLGGEFIIINKHLLKELVKRKLWDEDLRNELMGENGSVQNIDRIPADLKELYKTVWELPTKELLEMCRDRAWFVDQSQSMNVFMKNPTVSKVGSMHMYAWKLGLKTGMYYLRSNSTVDAVKFTVKKKSTQEEFKDLLAKAKEAAMNDEDCTMCGS